MNAFGDNLIKLVTEGKLYREIHHINFYYSHYMGDIINSYLDSVRMKEPSPIGLAFEDFNALVEESLSIKDVGYKRYFSLMINDFVDFALKNNDVGRCTICGKLFEYKKNKKYCSEECKIKAKNQRYYKKNSQKIKIKYLEK
jgi:hypothetical protein